ncbi:hypothetical protein [Candidatus Synechococcus spongiarum]|nr:hypothetical protein [Candidatus Synechococcus spongiarum]
MPGCLFLPYPTMEGLLPRREWLKLWPVALLILLANVVKSMVDLTEPKRPSNGIPQPRQYEQHPPPGPSHPMPAVPPELREWLTTPLQPAVILAGVGLIMKRIDDLRDSVNKRIDDLRADNQRLDGKVDCLVEALLAAKALTPKP